MSGGRVLLSLKYLLNLRRNSCCPESFGTGPDQATLINLLFSAILLVRFIDWVCSCLALKSVYGRFCYASVLPGLYRFRLDFLLDYPLTAFVTFSFV